MEEIVSIDGCMICGKPVIYKQEAQEAVCCGCGRHFMSISECEDGHFVCDDCHAAESLPVIYFYCIGTASRDPFEIACAIMKHPAIHMHGPENHVLIGSALLAAWHNSGGKLDLPEALSKMREYGKLLPGGICGTWGTCGAAVSAGIYCSIVTNSTPLKAESRKLSHLLTSKCLYIIHEYSGARCCKRDGFLAIQTTVDFTAEHLGVRMKLQDNLVCDFHERNNECLKESCPFYHR